MPKVDITRAERKEKTIELAGPWSFERSRPNVLVLDHCQLAMAEDSFGDKIPVIEANRLVMEKAAPLAELCMQPWWVYRKGLDKLKGGPVPFRLAFEFTNRLSGQPKLSLIIEEAHRFEVKVNGILFTRSTPYLAWGPEFEKIEIGEFTKAGQNSIELKGTYIYDLAMENIFILGDFAVKEIEKRKSFFLTEEPATLSLGNWIEEGYPFYPGNISLTFKSELKPSTSSKIFLEVPSFQAVGCKVEVNAHQAGIIGWHGSKLLISPYLKTGVNQFRLTLLGTTDNLFPPLHDPKELRLVDNNYWYDERMRRYTPEYQLATFGIKKAPRLRILSD